MAIRRLIAIIITLALAAVSAPAAPMSPAEYAAAKEAMLRRPRRVMHNNDGCDAVYYSSKLLPVTVEKFLSQRVSYTPGYVDTIVYTPVSSGFGQFSVALPGFDVLRQNPPFRADAPADERYHNAVDDLAALGTDAVQAVIDFAHAHNQEVFWCFRTNDTHDSHYTEKNDLAFFNPWKRAHRQFLFGDGPGKSLPNGSWSCVDFSHPEVRQRQIEMVRQVLLKYDIDGFEFDFSRYLPTFKSTALGGYASQEERDALTDMYRQIRRMVDEHGRQRGRPLLISMQLPDSVDYCRGIGIDLELWLREGLLDIWALPDSFRMDTYAASAALAHQYGRRFYPQMGYPYPYEREERNTMLRRTVGPAYHARAMAALASGVDGLHFANITDAGGVKSYMHGDLEWYRGKNKRYFVTDIGWEAPNGALSSGERWSRLPQLISRKPRWIAPGAPQDFTIEIGDDLPALQAGPNPPAVWGYLDLGRPEMQGKMAISSNGVPWERIAAAGEGRYEVFRIPSGALHAGANAVTLTATPPPQDADLRPIGHLPLFKEDGIAPATGYWSHRFASQATKPYQATATGWRITDTGQDDDDIANAMTTFLFRAGVTVFDFEARCLSSDHPMAAMARMADGRSLEILQLLPGKARLHYSGFECPLDTSVFHHYRLDFGPEQMTFSVDGRQLFATAQPARCDVIENAIQGWKQPDHRMNTSSFIIGSLSGRGSGVSEWRRVTLGAPAGSVLLNNLAVDVLFPANGPTEHLK